MKKSFSLLLLLLLSLSFLSLSSCEKGNAAAAADAEDEDDDAEDEKVGNKYDDNLLNENGEIVVQVIDGALLDENWEGREEELIMKALEIIQRQQQQQQQVNAENIEEDKDIDNNNNNNNNKEDDDNGSDDNNKKRFKVVASTKPKIGRQTQHYEQQQQKFQQKKQEEQDQEKNVQYQQQQKQIREHQAAINAAYSAAQNQQQQKNQQQNQQQQQLFQQLQQQTQYHSTLLDPLPRGATAADLFRHGVASSDFKPNWQNSLSQRALDDFNIAQQHINSPFDELLPAFEEAGKSGHAQAYFILGNLSYFGTDEVPQNFERAFEYFHKAAEMGHGYSQFMLGVMYSSGRTPTGINQAKAMLYFHFAALSNVTEALLALGTRYMYGIHCEKDTDMAFRYYDAVATQVAELFYRDGHIGGTRYMEKRRLSEIVGANANAITSENDVIQYYQWTAEKGDVSAMITLAHLFFHGAHGVSQDLQQALAYYRRAADLGNPDAMAYLGDMYLKGIAVTQSNETARYYFEKGLKAGHSGCRYGLGYMHLHGYGVPVDLTYAFKEIKTAADQGWNEAELTLALMYRDGLGVKRDYVKAFQLISVASSQGHTMAVYQLSRFLCLGIGVHKSCALGLHHSKIVAERNKVITILNIAFSLFDEGDYLRSLLWYEIAAECGFEIAHSNVAYMFDYFYGVDKNYIYDQQHHQNRHHQSSSSSSTTTEDGKKKSKDLASFRSIYDVKNYILSLLSSIFDVEALVTIINDFEINDNNKNSNNNYNNNYVNDKGDDENEYYFGNSTHPTAAVMAMRHYQQSALQGNVEAKVRVGDFHYYGHGTVVDYQKAAALYAEAGTYRHSQALFNLGFMYEFGIGLQKDFHLAKRHYDSSTETSPDAAMPSMIALYFWQFHAYLDSIDYNLMNAISYSALIFILTFLLIIVLVWRYHESFAGMIAVEIVIINNNPANNNQNNVANNNAANNNNNNNNNQNVF